MTTRESLSSYAIRLGWSVSTRECTDTYTAGDRSVFVDFSEDGRPIGAGMHGELLEFGEIAEGWAKARLSCNRTGIAGHVEIDMDAKTLTVDGERFPWHLTPEGPIHRSGEYPEPERITVTFYADQVALVRQPPTKPSPLSIEAVIADLAEATASDHREAQP